MDVITLGETMLRLSPPGHFRLEQANQLEMNFGGTESNVAINLARLGKQVAWYSQLPDNPLGHQCAASLRKHGVDVSHVTWTPKARMGLYFVEYGQHPRSIRVWYDRAGSAASHMTPDNLPLDLLGKARWLHITGITPALSPNCLATVQAAVQYAIQHGIILSFDVNYRALLWEPSAAAAALTQFCEQAKYVFIARRDAAALWGVHGEPLEVAYTLHERWKSTVIVTCGHEGAVAIGQGEKVTAPGITTTIVDRMGAGDAFASGVICRLLEEATLEDAMQFGVALATLKLTIVGDVALVSRAEIETLLAGTRRDLER